MAREEVQISDLEPSIIGEDVTKYAIQIRGVDGNGNEGPWSTILEYESPELLPSLQSDNYVEGQSGWFLDNDGTFEVNDGFIRGTLQSANYVTGVSGWALDQSGVVEFDQGVFRGALQIGTNTFRVDSNGNLSIGGSSASNAPFRVNTNGQILAMSINGDFIQSRTIRADRIRAGAITANEISSNYIYSNTIEADQISAGFLSVDRLEVNSINGNRLRNNTVGNGKIISIDADKITAGEIQSDVIFVGQLNGATGTFSGSLSGASGTFSGSLTATVTTAQQLRTTVVSSPNNLELRGVLGSGPGEVSGRVLIRGSRITLSTGDLRTGPIFGTGVDLVLDGDRIKRKTSSIKYKENIRKAPRLNNLLDVQPVYFNFKNAEDDTQRNVYGVIAEEVDALGLKELIYYNEGEPESVHYSDIGLALIPYVKELYDRIEELERRLDGN